MSEQLNQLEQYKVNRLKLISSDGNNVDITNFMLEMQICQSIHAQVMFGHLIVSDAMDLGDAFAMHGHEYLDVSLDVPTLNEPLERVFRVFSVTKKTHAANAGAKYIIEFCSKEHITSLYKRVSKAYKSITIGEMVADVLRNYLNVDNRRIGFLDTTSGIYDVVIPNQRPLEAIHWLCSRAYTSNEKYAYHFFETFDGFEFAALQTMYDRAARGTYTYDLKAITADPAQNSDKSANRFSFTKIQIVQDFDVIKATASGGYAASLLTVDLRNQTYKISVYNAKLAEKYLLNENTPINDSELLNSIESNLSVYVETQDGPDEKGNQIHDWFLQRRLHNNLLNHLKIKGTLPGDILIKPGEIIDFKMPAFVAPKDGDKKFDSLRSGKYLICDVVHTFAENLYNTELTLLTDSYAGALPSSKNISARIR